MNTIGKILPVDGFQVEVTQTIPMDYLTSLTHLYQPLIGSQAIALFQTLFHDHQLAMGPQTHHTLMSYLKVPLDEIYKARLQLEGIGLLKTYSLKEETKTIFLYALQRPFAPREFFNDAMLAQLLYHHIGQDKFERLQRIYDGKDMPVEAENITKSFHDVFQTFQPTKYNLKPVTKSAKEEEIEVEDSFDYEWVENMLKQRMIPVHRVLTAPNRRLISQMTTLYQLESIELDKAILWALDDENELNIDEFKQVCHDLHTANNNHKPINLTLLEEKPAQVPETFTGTKADVLLQKFETMSPKQLLEDLSNGNKASDQDMKAIREVMSNQGLPASVMNVLIHYVLLQTNMKLSKAYLEKIASHWSRVNIKTAKQAMDFAISEKNQITQPRSQTNYKRTSTNEVIPEWFKNRKHKEQQADEEKQEVSEAQKRLQARLQKYSNND